MSLLNKLVKQTAVYGISTVLGRFLNYLLVMVYTRVFFPSEYSVIGELYAYVGVFMVLFTYGMETAFFRFIKEKAVETKVFSTSWLSLIITSVFFGGMMFLFLEPIIELINFDENPLFIILIIGILAMDAISAIPFARLRYLNKALQFSGIRLISIFSNIILVLLLIVIFPLGSVSDSEWIRSICEPFIYSEFGVGFVFLSNFLASLVTLILLWWTCRKETWTFDFALWKRMMIYALPLLIVGFSGMINEMFDRIMLKQLLPFTLEENKAQLGIYNACYKLSIIMTIFIQAYRYGAEPFFFQNAEKDKKTTFANTTKAFIYAAGFIYIFILSVLPVLKWMIDPAYFDGLAVVPILLMANLFLGLYFNLSMWYKLTDKTMLGAAVSVVAAILTMVLNIYWIPIFGYIGSAWATLICYAFLAIVSWLLSNKYFKVEYDVKRIFAALIIPVGLYFLYLQSITLGLHWIVAAIITWILYGTSIYFIDRQFIKEVLRGIPFK